MKKAFVCLIFIGLYTSIFAAGIAERNDQEYFYYFWNYMGLDLWSKAGAFDTPELRAANSSLSNFSLDGYNVFKDGTLYWVTGALLQQARIEKNGNIYFYNYIGDTTPVFICKYIGETFIPMAEDKLYHVFGTMCFINGSPIVEASFIGIGSAPENMRSP